MTIDEAIEILDLEISCDFEGNEKDRQDAVKLGIEALKHIYELRHHHNVLPDYLLPGETEE